MENWSKKLAKASWKEHLAYMKKSGIKENGLMTMASYLKGSNYFGNKPKKNLF